jgi:type IX secretion system PorP/SprF family membrane protein
MHTKARAILFLAGFLFSVTSVSGQDAVFSQFYANPVYLNPALAGNILCPRIALNYRNQYPALSGNYVTYNVAADMYSKPLHGGIAILATADKTGPLGSFSGDLVYSYHLMITEKLRMNAALQAGYLQYRLNWEELVFENMIDPSTGQIDHGSNPDSEPQPDKLTVGDVDFSTGMVSGYYERFYLGFAAHHITNPDIAFYQGNISRLATRFTIHAGGIFNLKDALAGQENDNLSLSPNIVYMQQGDFHQLNGGMYLNFYPFVTGLWFRHNFENPDALIAMLGFQQPTFKIGYSYDFTLSKLGMPAGGAHEISFVWYLPCPKKDFQYKAIKCPGF